MTTKITQSSDPELWTKLYNKYIEEGQPRNVTLGSSLYEIIHTTDFTYEFTLVNTIDYIDSRSLKNSRGASYNDLSQ